MQNIIKQINAYEILDSRGNPTVEAEVILESGITGIASVPSGASVGRYEAVELRDGDSNRYLGKGVLRAVRNIKDTIADALTGLDTDQEKLDHILMGLDGTPNKSRLGANAILAVSLAAARAGAKAAGVPLYRNIVKQGRITLPIPMMNVLNGGVHASNNVDIQEFMLVPIGAKTFEEGLRWCAETYSALKKVIRESGASASVGDEGGFAPNLDEDAAALELLLKASEQAGHKPGKEIAFAIDAAASEWYSDGNEYNLPKSGGRLSRTALCDYWDSLTGKYPIVSLEDGMAQEDYEGWKELTQRLGAKIQLVGDDLFVTNPSRIQEGVQRGLANSVLIKLNQIGTLSETLEAIKTANKAGYSSIVSHRSGETEDPFIADLAAATGCGQIKSGAPARGERTAKYNRLLQIAREAGEDAVYAGPGTIRNFNK